MNNHKLKDLDSFLLFTGLPEPVLSSVSRHSGTRRYARGKTIFSQGEESDHLCALIEGIVRLYRVSAEGSENTVALVSSGELFGELSAIDGKPRSAAAVSLTEVEMLHIPRTVFQELMGHPEVTHRLLEQLALKIREADESLDRMAFVGARGRIAGVLMKIAAAQQSASGADIVPFWFTHREIGSMANTTRETVSRVLGGFLDSGLIGITGGGYALRDIGQLRKLAGAQSF